MAPLTTHSPPRLHRTFFARHFLTVARDLVGTHFFWNGCGGMVVETEAYAHEGDSACHTATRPGTRSFVAEHPPGTAYVYLNYGMYWLLNVLALDGIVLIRALEPTLGLETMRERRHAKSSAALCNGPGKLGRALGLGRDMHGLDLTCVRDGGFHERARCFDDHIVCDVRIGISTAQELPWRFLVPQHPHVSVPFPAPVNKIGTRASRRK